MAPQIASTTVAVYGKARAIVITDLTSGARRVVARPSRRFAPVDDGDFAFSGFSHPAWSPDGRWLAFAAAAPDPSTSNRGLAGHGWRNSVYIVRADGSGLRQVVGSASAERDSAVSAPQWTPDGRSVVVSGYLGRHTQIVPVFRGAERARQDRPVAKRITIDAASATWAPDAKRFAFSSTRDANGIAAIGNDGPDEPAAELYIGTPTSHTQRRITSTTDNETDPAWSPDGRLIMFDLDEGAGAPFGGVLYVIRPDGTCRTPLKWPTDTQVYTGDGFAWRPGSDTTRLKLSCR